MTLKRSSVPVICPNYRASIGIDPSNVTGVAATKRSTVSNSATAKAKPSATPAAPPEAAAATATANVGPDTLAIDVGGTGVKASVLDGTGHMEHERVRVETPYPLTPPVLITTIDDLVRSLPPFDRISLGFPGMVREGKILTAPHFLSRRGADGKPEPELVAAWSGFDLQAALKTAFGKPAKVANDADLQGAAVVTGHGLELVVTLGTGVGTGLFYRGQLCPHLELAQHPLRGKKTYNEVLGEAAREKAGNAKWNKRVRMMIATLHTLLYWDHLYLGGGNAVNVKGDLPPGVSLIDNSAGILGGIRLWELSGPS
jgi:polyphosphate glucokinase